MKKRYLSMVRPRAAARRFAFLLWGLFLGAILLLGAAEDFQVFLTPTGARYHLESCSSLRNSPRKSAVSLGEAVRRGFTPCGICNPPVLDGGEDTPEADGARTPGIYRLNQPGPDGRRLSSSADADRRPMLNATVSRHVDGDTFHIVIENPPPELHAEETVRLIGVDTPETVHPNRSVERFGHEASAYTRSRLLGRRIRIAFDRDLRDRYDRLLCYVYTEGGCFNAELIRQGYGFAYTRFPFQFMDEFRQLEREAREARRGMWAE